MASDQAVFSRVRTAGFIPVGDVSRWSDPERRMFQEMARLLDRNRHRSIQYVPPTTVVHQNQYSGVVNFTTRIQTSVQQFRVGEMSRFRNELEAMFNDMIQLVQRGLRLRDTDRVMVSISDGQFNVSTSMEQFSGMNASTIFNLVMRTLQSFEFIRVNRMRLAVKYAKIRSGGAHLRTAVSYRDFVKRKRCVYEVTTRRGRNDCFYQCLAMGLAENGDDFSSVRAKKRQKERERRADVLRRDVDLHPPRSLVPVSSIGAVCERVNVGIYVIRFQDMKFIFTPSGSFEKRMFMLYHAVDGHGGHFDYVSQDHVGALWNCRQFCFECMSGYQDIRHKCIKTCLGCKRTNCAGITQPYSELSYVCEKCNMKFYDEVCCSRHKCGVFIRCRDCNATYRYHKEEPHECGKYKCKNCHCMVDIVEDHQCFHERWTDEDVPKVGGKYLFYDYEIAFDEAKHIPAAVVAYCADEPDHPYVFEREEDFVDWLLTKSGYTCIAHNGGRYDLHFVKRQLIHRGIKTSDVVKGHNLMYMKVPNFKLRFVDSFRFIPTSLRRFPKTFGFEGLEKGYFPYRFFTLERVRYKGKMPPLAFFDFDNMSHDERIKALEWYDEHRDDDIDIWEMCIDYCKDDVKVLMKGCMAFRQLFLNITDGVIDPFQFITIASVCMAIYKRFHIPHNSIAVLKPREGEYVYEEYYAYIKRKYPEYKEEVLTMT